MFPPEVVTKLYRNFAQAKAAVQAWLVDYNTERPHESLKNRTPSEVRAAALDTNAILSLMSQRQEGSLRGLPHRPYGHAAC